MNPKVSIITPTFKRAHFLARAVDSILNQTYDNIQVVVVDDNAELPEFRKSTEETMQKYKDDPRVVYIQNEKNLGGGISRNVGINACDGEYVAFLDDDDEFEPPKIEMELKFMMMHNLDFCFSDLHMYDANGKLVEHRTRRFVDDWSAENLLRLHVLHALTSTPTFMIKREFLHTFGGYREVPMGQEFMLMWDALQYAIKHPERKIGYIPCSYIRVYLHNEGRISVGKNKIECEEKIYNLKSSQKPALTKKEVRYMDFRHYSVLAVSYLRGGDKIKAAINLLKAFNISPVDSVKEALQLLK